MMFVSKLVSFPFPETVFTLRALRVMSVIQYA